MLDSPVSKAARDAAGNTVTLAKATACNVVTGASTVVSGAIEECADEVQQLASDVNIVANALSDTLERQAALRTPALVAALVKPEGFEIPMELQQAASVSVTFCEQPCQLKVLRMKRTFNGAEVKPSTQLKIIGDLMHDASKSAQVEDGPWIWILKSKRLCGAIYATDLLSRSNSQVSWFRGLLNAARILRQRDEDIFLRTLQDRFGRAVAYCFAWDHYYCQCLWPLAVFCLVWVLLGITPTNEGELKTGTERIVWEIFKGVVALWVLFVTCRSWRESDLLGFPEDQTATLSRQQTRILNPEYNKDWYGHGMATAKLIFFALPLLLLFFCLVMMTMMAWVQLTLYMTYDWGDCVTLLCRDPAVKHGFWGWLAEVGADILLAIIFEAFHAIVAALAQLVVSYRNYEFLEDVKYGESMMEATLDGIERVMAFGLLGFVFVPDWKDEGNPCAADVHMYNCDCSDLVLYQFLGESAISCLHRRLDIRDRRVRFEKSLKGPFVVAPFVSIIIKVLSPLLARWLTWCAERARCCRLCCIWRGITRILAMIFYYGGDGVGGLRFVSKGWPYGEIVIADESVAQEDFERAGGTAQLDAQDAAELLRSALREVARKEFEPPAELLEVKLNTLLVACFAPIMPIGAVTTLVGWWLEGRFDLVKLCDVRRPGFPMDCTALHKTHRVFTFCAFISSCTFSLGVSMLTYNDDADDYMWLLTIICMPIAIALILTLTPGALQWTIDLCERSCSRRVHPAHTE